MLADETYSDQSFVLEVPARRSTDRDELGARRLLDLIASARADGAEINRRILRAVAARSEPSRMLDDVTLLALEVTASTLD